MRPTSSHTNSGRFYFPPVWPGAYPSDAENGITPSGSGEWSFSVWAPEKQSMILHLPDAEATADSRNRSTSHKNAEPGKVAKGRLIPMQKDEQGNFRASVKGLSAGDRYFYRPDGEKDYPDPASQHQPDGVHGASALVDHGEYGWRDSAWRGIPFAGLIFYEMHVGAYTPEGTFEAIIPRLNDLVSMGINAIELMPVAQCPGSRNWGYDGVFLYAPQNTYGGPEGLKRLVDACHEKGIAVFLDVVYNHLGREGNYLNFFAPYFADSYKTPWGKAFNFDGAWSDGVKEHIIGNVLYWAEYYHIDGLRLDAIHEIFDRNAQTIWDHLQEAVEGWQQHSGRLLYLVAESDLNSPRVIRSPEMGGYGFDAQWLDDFHHALYVLLDKEGLRHYRDFGSLEQLAKAYTQGFVHSGEYMWFRQRRHGASSAGISGERFIIFNQNHDLPGNRPGGERLSMLVDFERLKLAAAAMLLAPYVPMLFMGEEYGEEAPFYFFSDYGDDTIRDELREGRKKQFAAFEWKEEPPDSQEEAVFMGSKLQWDLRTQGKHKILLDWHRQLIQLRKSEPLLKDLSKGAIRADLVQQCGLVVSRQNFNGLRRLICLYNFSPDILPYVFLDPGSPAKKKKAQRESPGAVGLGPSASGLAALGSTIGLQERWRKVLASTDEPWPVAQDRYSPLPSLPEPGKEIYLAPWSVAVYAWG